MSFLAPFLDRRHAVAISTIASFVIVPFVAWFITFVTRGTPTPLGARRSDLVDLAGRPSPRPEAPKLRILIANLDSGLVERDGKLSITPPDLIVTRLNDFVERAVAFRPDLAIVFSAPAPGICEVDYSIPSRLGSTARLLFTIVGVNHSSTNARDGGVNLGCVASGVQILSHYPIEEFDSWIDDSGSGRESKDFRVTATIRVATERTLKLVATNLETDIPDADLVALVDRESDATWIPAANFHNDNLSLGASIRAWQNVAVSGDDTMGESLNDPALKLEFTPQ